jgi:hypothetical protein
MQLPSLLDSGRIVFPLGGTALSVRQSATACNLLSDPLSVRKFLSTPSPACPFPQGIRLHLKVLQEPNVSISTMLQPMTRVYRTVPLTVEVVSREKLDGSAFDALLDLDVGLCSEGQQLTDEQKELYQNRNNVTNNIDIVVYFVRTIQLSDGRMFAGCAAPFPVPSPAPPPSLLIAQTATRWTLPHEIGHMLGLIHVPGESCQPADPPPTRLMTGCGTDKIPGGAFTPTLEGTEKTTMLGSNFVQKDF